MARTCRIASSLNRISRWSSAAGTLDRPMTTRVDARAGRIVRSSALSSASATGTDSSTNPAASTTPSTAEIQNAVLVAVRSSRRRWMSQGVKPASLTTPSMVMTVMANATTPNSCGLSRRPSRTKASSVLARTIHF